MATSPIMYQPLLVAHLRDTKLGKERLGDIIDRQLRFNVGAKIAGEGDIQAASPGADMVAQSPDVGYAEKTLNGIVEIAGKNSALRRVTFSDSVEGSIGNEFQNALEDSPEALNGVMALEQGRAIAEQNLAAIEADLPGRPLADYRGGTLSLDPQLSDFVRRTWSAAARIDPTNAAIASHGIGRAVQLSITPRQRGPQWLDQGAAETIALMPGKIESWADMLGFVRGADDKALGEAKAAFGKAAGEQREAVAKLQSPDALAGATVARLLNAAKLDPSSAVGAAAGEQLLQAGPSDDLPGALGTAIAGAHKFSSDPMPWLAGRIAELDGRPDNAEGLIAQLRERAADIK